MKKRKSILTNDFNRCYVCKRYIDKGSRNIHEVYFGVNRQRSIDNDCCLPLCTECHRKVHKDHDLDWRLKQECQRKFEEIHGFIKFMEVFRKNYL